MHRPTIKQMLIGFSAVAGMFLVGALIAAALSVTSHAVEPPEASQVTVIQPEGYEGIPHERRVRTRAVESRIYWRTPRISGASPLAVLRATAKQMESEQGTPLGNDANARALILTMQAIATLEGRKTETADGTPIIE